MLRRTLFVLCVLIISGGLVRAQVAPITPTTVNNVNDTQYLGTGRPYHGTFSPDGKLLALVGTFGVQVYELSAPDIPDTLGETPYFASDSAFSPDNTKLAVAGGYSVRLYDLNGATDPVALYPDALSGPLYSIAYHPNGTHIALGTTSGQLLIFDSTTLAPLQVIEAFPARINTLSYDREGGFLVAASNDNTAALFDTANNYALITRFERHLAPITDVIFAPGTLYTASLDNTINAFSLPDGTFLNTVYTGTGPIHSLALSPTGELYVGETTETNQNQVILLDPPSGQFDPLQDTRHREPVTALNLSSDTSRLLSVSADFANITAVQSRDVVGLPFMDTLYAIAITPEGDGIALGGTVALGGFYGNGGALYANFATDEAPIRTLAYDATGGVLIAGTDANKVYVFTGDGNRFMVLEDVPAPLTAAQFSPDNNLLALGFANGVLRLYDSVMLTLQTEGVLHGDAIESLDFSPDGTRLITASRDTNVLMWDVSTLTITGGLIGHTAPVLTVEFSPDGTRVVTGGEDAAYVWDVESQTQLFPLLDIYGAITSARFSPDGTLILITSLDATDRLYNAETGAGLVSFYDHNAAVYDGAWLPDNLGFITVGADGYAITYEVIP